MLSEYIACYGAIRRRGQDSFYTEDEYQIAALRNSGRNLLELGRSCVHPDYRGGMAMYQLWSGLAAYVLEHKIEILFGVASFHGSDLAALAGPLSILHTRYLAPTELRVRAHATGYQTMDLLPADRLDRRGGNAEDAGFDQSLPAAGRLCR